jgi:ribosomal-protein-alanine N-acetyltransferase
MRGEVEIRLADARDLPDIVRLERGVPEAPHWSESEYAAILTQQAGAVRRCLWVAATEDGISGFAVGKVLGSEAELESVAVSSDARRLGIGRSLCEAVLSWAHEQGAESIELEVRAGSTGAIRLYEALGFAKNGRRAGYYRDPADDAVLMRRAL